MSVAIRVSSEATQRRLAAVRGALAKNMGGAMEASVRLLEAEVKGVRLSAKPRGGDGLFRGSAHPNDGLAAPTGILRSSVRGLVISGSTGTGARWTGIVGTPVKWMGIHERGGRITGNPWLAIPTKYARQFAARASRGVGGATWWQRSKAGALFKWGRLGSGKNARIVPLVMLVHSVVMPRRAPFFRALQSQRPAIKRLFAGAVSGAVRVSA